MQFSALSHLSKRAYGLLFLLASNVMTTMAFAKNSTGAASDDLDIPNIPQDVWDNIKDWFLLSSPLWLLYYAAGIVVACYGWISTQNPKVFWVVFVMVVMVHICVKKLLGL